MSISEEIIYRPPFESGSFLLVVTHGCSHNKCSFCTMYRDVPFSVETDRSIEEQLQKAARFSDHIHRVFLENGDPFALSADRLSHIAEMIHNYFPKVDTIAMYASVNNIRTKSDQELISLRKSGINDLNIGIESGLYEALTLMNKGYTAQQAENELLRLRAAGFNFGANIIFGAAGKQLWRENADATAQLMNKTKPNLIFTGTIHADPGCPLYEDLKSGAFQECTFGDYLDEEEHFLSQLELEDCLYFGAHPSNVVPMKGPLPAGKDAMLLHIQETRSRLHFQLDQIPKRSAEGAIVFNL